MMMMMMLMMMMSKNEDYDYDYDHGYDEDDDYDGDDGDDDDGGNDDDASCLCCSSPCLRQTLSLSMPQPPLQALHRLNCEVTWKKFPPLAKSFNYYKTEGS